MKKYRYFILDIIGFIVSFQVILFFYGSGNRHSDAIALGILYFIFISFYYSYKYINYLKQGNDRDKISKIIIIRIFRTLIILVPALLSGVSNFLHPNKYDELYIRYEIFYVIVVICLALRLRFLLKLLKKEDDL